MASLSDSVFVLPDLQVGETFTLVVSLANTGDDTLHVDSIASSNPNVVPVIDSLVILPGGEGPIELRIVPSDTGFYQAELVVSHDAATSPDSLALEGVAGLRAVTLEPVIVSFGDVEPGFPAIVPVVLLNGGPVPFEVTEVVLEGPGFSVGDVPGIVELGAAFDLLVTFDPDGPGPFAGSLVLEHDDPFVELLRADFEGNGVGVSFGTVQRELVFVNPGLGGEVRDTLIVDNQSDQPIVLTPQPVSVSFRVDPDTLIIEPGAQGTLLVVFVSDGPGKRVEDLLITHDAPGRPDLLVPLLVVGGHPDIALADVEIDFGAVAVADSVSRSTTVDNPGSDTLFVSITHGPDTPFLVDPLDFAVPPGSSAEITVLFIPTRPGPRAEVIVAASNAGQGGPEGPPPSVTLVGTGLGPDLQLEPGVLVFGSLDVGIRDTQRVTFRNSGNDTLRLGQPEWADTAFTVGLLDSLILPGDERSLSVFYLPPDVEPRSDTLWVSTNVLGRERVPILLQALEVPRNRESRRWSWCVSTRCRCRSSETRSSWTWS